MNEIEDLLKANNQTSVDFTSGRVEVQRPDYPIVALQQIVRNAILHRSYENTNAPCGSIGFVIASKFRTRAALTARSRNRTSAQPGAYDYRNPNLAAAMKDLGYVQRFGFGIATARRELEKNGNPPLEFQVEDSACRGHHQEAIMSIPVIAFFNNKGVSAKRRWSTTSPGCSPIAGFASLPPILTRNAISRHPSSTMTD